MTPFRFYMDGRECTQNLSQDMLSSEDVDEKLRNAYVYSVETPFSLIYEFENELDYIVHLRTDY